MTIRHEVSLMAVIAASLVACSDSAELSMQAKLAIDADASIVIRQIYGGGSNTSAAFTHDFIELFNRSQHSVTLSGWSLQYASASGSGNFGATTTQLSELPDITLAPGQSYLVQEAGTGSVGSPLPTPDLVDPTPINLSASAGKVALVRSNVSIGCNGSSAPCGPDALALIVDLVGYGSANFAEGQPAPATDNAVSAQRRAGGCSDTNDNAADFAVASPEPRNLASPGDKCSSDSGTGGAAGSRGVTGAGGTAGNAGAPTGIGGMPEPGPTRIHDIQGSAHRSRLEGASVDRVYGIVTHVVGNGFYLQDPAPDTDPATSEAIFVFTNGTPNVLVGDAVLVSGRVSEFRPGCSNCSPSSSAYANLTTTEIDRPSQVVRTASAQPLPATTLLGPEGRGVPNSVIDDDDASSVEDADATFTPDSDGIDFYESLEGMRVQIAEAVAVGPSNDFGELPVLAAAGANASLRSARGGIVITARDFNPERVIIDSDSMPDVNVGDSFAGSVVGVMDYSFGNYKLLPTEPLPPLTARGLRRESAQLGSKAVNDLDIATLNVENLDPGDPPAKFEALARIIVHNLASPDLLSLEEVQDDSGATNDAIVGAGLTLRKLTTAISELGGPVYQWRTIDPVDGQDGGEPGGNIRVVFLYRIDRGLSFADRPGASSTTPNLVVSVNAQPQLAFSPGRINPGDAAFSNSRKPLAGEFQFNGQRFFVIANHFNSKGGDQPLFGRFQPPMLGSEVQRFQQARQVADFVSAILAIDANAHVVVLGDLNDFEFSPPLAVLEAVGMTTLVRTLPLEERYTYVFDGNSQTLDHVLLSAASMQNLRAFDIVHLNAEFATQWSDHDPAISRISLGALPTQAVIPVLECVERLGALNWLAHFGYDNPNTLVVTRAVGRTNRLIPPPADRGQPTTFAPGRQRDVLEVPFRGGIVGWRLDGRAAFATALSPRCPLPSDNATDGSRP